ncbi:MAG: thermonuclease family protein, partial [Candidatus Dojkabacteria bacterium]|nr:thermonuclease family protein [Candidatus Dojkabacteria bacterium]
KKVIDGDTIEVENKNQKIKIRLIGINTPELNDNRKEVQCFAEKAKNFLKQLIENTYVRLEIDQSQNNQDKYGRLLRYVIDSENNDVGLILIQNGYAYEYTYKIPHKKSNIYKQAQQYAQENNIGLWGNDECRM